MQGWTIVGDTGRRFEFEWDRKKASSNLEKHGVAFEDAAWAFDDEFSLTLEDRKHSQTEKRMLRIGVIVQGLLVVVYTERFETSNRYRIISARFANKKERSLYDQKKKDRL